MISKTKQLAKLSLAIVVGVGAFAAFSYDASAQGGNQTICYKGRTLVAPPAIAARYIAGGATQGPCDPSASAPSS